MGFLKCCQQRVIKRREICARKGIELTYLTTIYKSDFSASLHRKIHELNPWDQPISPPIAKASTYYRAINRGYS